MSAREMIAEEVPQGILYARNGTEWELAAERVIDRIQKRVEELEKQIEVMDKSDTDWDKERYRDRLDRMVASKSIVGISDIINAVSWGMKALAAIDAQVENRG